MTLTKAKEVIEHTEKQFIREDNGRFQDIKFTLYGIAKRVVKENEDV
ncbi:MAG: hypothetical protein GY928_23265 [Colwellia sp.]|nr:hypothetical protein [Colwellia sp.]